MHAVCMRNEYRAASAISDRPRGGALEVGQGIEKDLQLIHR